MNKKRLKKRRCPVCKTMFQPKRSKQRYCSPECVRAKAQPGAGRPPLIDKEALKKLNYAFMMGLSDIQACAMLDISPQTLYNYQKKHPEYVERKSVFKEMPVAKAKAAVFKGLDDFDRAFRYLERKCRAEFGPGMTIEGGDRPIKISVTDNADL